MGKKVFARLGRGPTIDAHFDDTLAADVAEYDFSRASYVCKVCEENDELSTHKYVDECPFYEY